MPQSTFSKFIIPVVGIVGIVILANYMISTKAFPSLGEFLASSTNQFASSTDRYINQNKSELQFFDKSYATTTIKLKSDTLRVQIANNPTQRELGLSNRESLPNNAGMLFIFPSVGKYGFWMKDMNFPIDIIWIRSNREVVGIAKDVSPDTFPQFFYPPSDIQFVLEVNAGASDRLGIATGTVLNF
ncbi:MAG: DUF192 domain-containing protein [Candidatus Paceibacterota bacterium]|jgi:hypothetical protein